MGKAKKGKVKAKKAKDPTKKVKRTQGQVPKKRTAKKPAKKLSKRAKIEAQHRRAFLRKLRRETATTQYKVTAADLKRRAEIIHAITSAIDAGVKVSPTESLWAQGFARPDGSVSKHFSRLRWNDLDGSIRTRLDAAYDVGEDVFDDVAHRIANEFAVHVREVYTLFWS